MNEISLREATPDDYGAIKSWLEDPENNAYFTSELRGARNYERIFFLIALKRTENAYFIVVDEDGSSLGLAALINIDYGDRTGQLWYVTGEKKLRGRGVMTQAVGRLVEKAGTLGLHNVFTWVVEGNDASIRVLEKNGFSLFGCQRESFFDGKTFKDKYWYEKVL